MDTKVIVEENDLNCWVSLFNSIIKLTLDKYLHPLFPILLSAACQINYAGKGG
jgi:hypothetical protein